MRYGKTYEIGLCGIIAVLLSLGSVSAERVWVDDGRAAVSVHVPQGLMADDASLPRDIPYPERRIEEDRRRLRESVRDLLKYVDYTRDRWPDGAGNVVSRTLNRKERFRHPRPTSHIGDDLNRYKGEYIVNERKPRSDTLRTHGA